MDVFLRKLTNVVFQVQRVISQKGNNEDTGKLLLTVKYYKYKFLTNRLTVISTDQRTAPSNGRIELNFGKQLL